MLVAPPGLVHAPFVLAERRSQKPCLRPHPSGGAVEIIRSEGFMNQFLEPIDVLRLAAEKIVEAEHLGDEARAELKRQLATGRGRRARGRLCDDVALEGAEASRRIREPRVKVVVQLVSRDDRRLRSCSRQHPLQVLRCAARRDDDDGFRATGNAQPRDRVPENV
jgi:hypothetical protein